MNDHELADPVTDLTQLVALVEETGERVILTEEGEQATLAESGEYVVLAEDGEHMTLGEDGGPVSVLLPAAELAELEHFAQRYLRAPLPLPVAAGERPPGPEKHGPYVRYVHADGERATFTRGRAVVVESRPAAWLDRLEEQAMYGRQGYMPPKQLAAFEEFLARQPPVGEQ
ncbi:type II toxin-antitoxin system Phd/YefM family antitoxin [Streptomyces sp. NPDC054863]